MSQAIQQHMNLNMIRDEHLLAVAEKLIPTVYSREVQPRSIVKSIEDGNVALGWRAEHIADATTFLQQSFSPGDTFIIDFGEHCVGSLNFSCDSAGSPPDAPAHLQFIFGETLCEVSEPFSEYQGWLSSSWLQQHDEYIDIFPEEKTLPRRYCFRYIKVRVVSLSPKYTIRFTRLSATTVSSAPHSYPEYHTHDALLKKIDEVSVQTLRNCMHDVFEDGPKRDRRLWLGDLRLQALVNDVTFAKHDLVKRCLYLFAGHRREDGMVAANIFARPEVKADDTYLFDYSLFFVDTLYNYLIATQDIATAKELWPVAIRQVELALERCDHTGLVRDSDDWWSFIDWNDSLNKQAPSQGVLIYCVEKAIQLAMICQPERGESLQKQLLTLKNAASTLFDEETGYYFSGNKYQFSYASQIWMVLAEMGDLVHRKNIMLNLLKNPPSIEMNTPYLRHHFIDALIKCGLRNEAIQEIKQYWGAMVEFGADTFWELFDPKNPSFSPYGSKLINSYCHAWSCTPAWFIRQFGL